MPRINLPTDITDDMRETKRDYLDRHTPHVEAPANAVKGQPFDVKVRMGQDYVHPDVDDHYIQSLQLFDGETLLGTVTYTPGATTRGMEAQSGHAEATFRVALGKKGRLTAISYCTKHGLWMSEEQLVEVQ